MRGRKTRSLRFEPLENRIVLDGSYSNPASAPSLGGVFESDSALASNFDAVCFPTILDQAASQLASATPITFVQYSTQGQEEFSQWFDLHRPYLPADMASMPTPEALLLAQRSMFLQASAKVSQLGIPLVEAINNSPAVNYWSGSGDTANFLEAAFNAFEVPGQFKKVILWHTPNDHYVAIEYFSTSFGKSVFYDPLYGVMLLDPDGIPAGVNELFHQLSTHGRNFDAWEYQPVRIDGLLSLDNHNASDPEFQFFLDRDYERVLNYYTTLIATSVLTQSSPITEHVTLLQAASSASSESTRAILQSANEAFTDPTGQTRSVAVYLATIDNANIPDPSEVNPATRLTLFADAITSAPQDPRTQSLNQWVASYVSSEEIAANSDAVLNILTAYRRMSRIATQYETSGSALFERILDDPNYAGWGHAGTSVDFMIAALSVLGIQAFRISLFHTQDDSHTLLGYYDLDRVPQLADPLYGTIFEDASGNRVALPFLQREIAHLSPSVRRLNIFGRKIDPTETSQTVAADQDFQYFINHDWTTNAHFYLNLVAIRDSSVPIGGSASQQNWLVFEQTEKTRSPSEREKIALLQSFAQSSAMRTTNNRSVNLLNWVNTDTPANDPENTLERITSPANAFLESLSLIPLTDASDDAWMDAWLEAHAITSPTATFGTAERIVDSLYRMYLNAQVTEADLGVTMTSYLAENPTASIWAQCGSTVEFLIQMLRHFNVPARRIQMWHALDDHHVALEYYSQAAGKFVFYDPLYGRLLLDENGVPASFEELSTEAQRAGLQFDQWAFTPVMWRGLEEQNTADPRLSEFFNHNYFRILKYYLNITAVEHESITTGLRPEQWNSTAKGSWDVTVRPTYSDYMDLPQSMNFLDGFLANYGADQQGRFYIAAYTEVTPNFEPASFPQDAWDRFWTNNETRTESFATNEPLVQSWLDAHRPSWLDISQMGHVDALVLTFVSIAQESTNLSNAVYDFIRLFQSTEVAEAVVHLPVEDQLVWCLRLLGTQASWVVLGDGATAPHSFVEYVSPGQRKAVLIDLDSNQMFVDENGVAAGILELRIDYERATANDGRLRFMPVSFSMLEPDLQEQPWVGETLRRKVPVQVAGLIEGMNFILRNEQSLSLNDSGQAWTLRYTDRGDAPTNQTPTWFQEQASDLLARHYGVSSSQIAHIASYVSTID